MQHPATAVKADKIAELSRSGYSVNQIAKSLGLTERSVSRYRAAAGLSRPAHKKLSDEQMRTAAMLYADECPLTEIARTVGCNVSTIQKKFAGVPHPRKPNPLGKYHRELAESLGVWFG